MNDRQERNRSMLRPRLEAGAHAFTDDDLMPNSGPPPSDDGNLYASSAIKEPHTKEGIPYEAVLSSSGSTSMQLGMLSFLGMIGMSIGGLVLASVGWNIFAFWLSVPATSLGLAASISGFLISGAEIKAMKAGAMNDANLSSVTTAWWLSGMAGLAHGGWLAYCISLLF